MQVSTDNETFTPVVSDTLSVTLGDTVNLFETVNARYVRITISGATPSNFWASIREASVFYDAEPTPEIY
ncbi:discoidin domain-containing protein [Paenibacillus sp. Sa2BVA9]|uniref:Discoidin domain-containing protein n=1 Tax=Paenibacillus gallinarum TaxID=2762232 RepID=A0ABR8T0A4_9BACL|nr:discoidin domain-containing protein [Paenibacillus gallinarum]